jgi:glutamate-ammonia-ligase adenylyltransferase
VELVKVGAINAKYSPGGLVDLEYFVQARQIEQGAFDKDLRVTNTMEALSRLEKTECVDGALAADIRTAYSCLRRVIDALRAVRGNAKDLAIPPWDSRAFRYLARRVGYESNESLREELEKSMAVGRGLWSNSDSTKQS